MSNPTGQDQLFADDLHRIEIGDSREVHHFHRWPRSPTVEIEEKVRSASQRAPLRIGSEQLKSLHDRLRTIDRSHRAPRRLDRM